MITLHFVLDRRGINWLPSIFGVLRHLTILHHSVNNLLLITISSLWCCLITSFSLCVLLVSQSHWELSYIYWVIRILHHNSILLFILLTRVLRLLNWSESTSLHFVIGAISFVNGACSAWRYTHILLFTTSINSSVTNVFLLDWFLNSLEHYLLVTWSSTTGVWSCCREEASFITTRVFVLSGIESLIFRRSSSSSSSSSVLSSGSTCSNTSYMSSISSVTVFTFNWLNYRIVKVNNKVIIDCILIRGFRLSNWMLSTTIVVTSGLSSSMKRSNSFIWRSILLIFIWFIDSSVLDSLIIKWVLSVLLNSLDWRSYKFI